MYSTTQLPTGQVLHDILQSGREQPWAKHKIDAQLLSYALMDNYPDAAQRIRHCADTLWFRRTETGALKLDTAHFCRVRMCPVCQWRRSLKMYGQLHQIVDAMQADRAAAGRKPYNWALITLTVRNCAPDELSHTLDILAQGWGRMSRVMAWRRAVQGTMRAMEITYNRADGTYHPHIHVLACVLPSYWHSRAYISQAQLTDMWRDACRLDYTPIVDMRRATGDPKSLAEVAKYTTKPSDYLDPSDLDMMADVAGTLYRVCGHRRFAAYTGILRQYHHTLHLDDVDDGDLVHVDALDGESEAGATAWAWDWYAGPKLYIGGARNG